MAVERRNVPIKEARSDAMERSAMNEPLALGIDIGTSGVRAVATDAAHMTTAAASTAMAAPERDGDRAIQDPAVWWNAVCTVLDALRAKVDFSRIGALSVDGTSGTILAVDAAGRALAPASLYNDSSAKAAAEMIAKVAPPETAAHGATSPVGRALAFTNLAGVAHVLHQADWILAQFSGRFGVSDENNALKTGYDPVRRKWPDWLEALAIPRNWLPEVVAAGTAVATVSASMQERFGFNTSVKAVAGTTDGCAAFLATGAHEIGDGVTSLGTTLVVKLLSDKPIFEPQYGLYSHRIGDLWLAGGASNSGGAALLKFFTTAQMVALEPQMAVDKPTGLDYYPLSGVGERFPIYDPKMQSRVSPRPSDDARFLQALLEGISNVEALAYQRMTELGGPTLANVFTVGGGARNRSWANLRARVLGVPLREPASEEAAVGAALLAWRGLRER